MFKRESLEDSIYESMKDSLASIEVEKSYGLSKIAKALDFLNEAAELFDNAGMISESSEITDVINSFAQTTMPDYAAMGNALVGLDQKKNAPAQVITKKDTGLDKLEPSVEWKDSGEKYKGYHVYMDLRGKYIINGAGNRESVPLPSRNKFNLKPADIEKVQVSLNKIIEDFDGPKPNPIVADQAWNNSTEKAFNWYSSVLNKAPMQSLNALLSQASNAPRLRLTPKAASSLINLSQAIMPAYTMLDGQKHTTPQAEKVDLAPAAMPERTVLDGKLLPQPASRNRFGLSLQDIERVQLSLNKIINKFQGQKPNVLIPDQKWGPNTNKAFDWYDKQTNNSPMLSLMTLLKHTGNNETIGGMS